MATLIAFGFVAFSYTTVRLTLLFDARRPINKSEPIIRFSSYCKAIYYSGLVVNVWINTFLLDYVERYYIIIIKFAPEPITADTIFLLKTIITFIYLALLIIVSNLILKIISALSPKTLISNSLFIQNGSTKNTGSTRI